MKTNFEITQEINTLSKKHYGDNDLAFAWGCAQALLTTQQLNLILGILKKKRKQMNSFFISGNALFWFSFICLFYGSYLFVKGE